MWLAGILYSHVHHRLKWKSWEYAPCMDHYNWPFNILEHGWVISRGIVTWILGQVWGRRGEGWEGKGKGHAILSCGEREKESQGDTIPVFWRRCSICKVYWDGWIKTLLLTLDEWVKAGVVKGGGREDNWSPLSSPVICYFLLLYSWM